ncbi:hypothetical protein ElyMa_005999900 [Elysia marginata]|uniref:Uncharacterized protein n=1 Tax=Elysia marginata TaxID=1093978 RepID=A0AAV4GFA0_9GAST|nr:hypothetical protein ElyMa_005999900 [Elysia marginata]
MPGWGLLRQRETTARVPGRRVRHEGVHRQAQTKGLRARRPGDALRRNPDDPKLGGRDFPNEFNLKMEFLRAESLENCGNGALSS